MDIEPKKTASFFVLRDLTPDRLRLFMALSILATIFFCVVAICTVQQHKDAARTVGYDAGPSVIAAHEIKNAVVRMGNELANELLKPGAEGDWSTQDYEKWRVVACKQLVVAASNITYGLAEQEPIEDIQIALGLFESEAQQALDYRRQGNVTEAMKAYRAALSTLDEQIVPAADRLERANRDQLESIYAREQSASALLCGFTLVTGLILIGLLLMIQIFLWSRFRRRLSLPIFLITLCSLVVVQQLYTTLRENAVQLKVAKQDAYDSIIALLDARSDAYLANAAVSHWILTDDKKYADIFPAKIGKIASFSGISSAEVLATASKKVAAGESTQIKGFEGYIADELNNIRFDGEGGAALEALQHLCEYCQIEERVRALRGEAPSQAAHMEQASELALGFYPNQSQYAFSKFDDSVGHVVKINEEHFASAIGKALRKLDGLIVIVQIFAVMVLFCVFAGLRARLAEFSR